MAANVNNKSLMASMLSASLYKRNQGRMVRQLTFLGLVLAGFYGVWTLSNQVLSSYVTSTLSVAVSFNPSVAGENFESSLADKFGGYPSTSSDDGAGGARRVRFHAPTSGFGETDSDLRAAAAKVFDTAKVELAGKPGVRVSEPTHRVRQIGWVRLGIPVVLAALAVWCVLRAVNYPKFADFLISVEAEMGKVSWASRAELYRATVVVLTTMVFLGALLFVYDQLWVVVFRVVHFLEI